MNAHRGIREINPFTAAVFASYQRPEFWYPLPWQRLAQVSDAGQSLVFPEEDMMQELIQTYFATVNLVVPLLHRPTFERSVAAGFHLRNRSFGFIVLAPGVERGSARYPSFQQLPWIIQHSTTCNCALDGGTSQEA
ncbi:hypothetical protein MPER_02483 [Moniliophthora perniciosa FA553]|nr:hypothetical protein MPER_02483 [Moniliophthora perniciosa FA553]